MGSADGAGCCRRARTFRITSALARPAASASAQAASTALKPIGEHGGQDLDHLPVAVIGAGQLASHLLQRARQRPVLERRAVAQRAGLPRQHRHVVPGIVGDLIAAEAAGVLADHHAILLDDDAVGIGMDVDRPADRWRDHRVLVAVEAHQAGLRHRGARRWKPSNAAAIGDQRRPLGLEHLEDGLVLLLGMRLRLGIGDALSRQPAVEVLQALERSGAARRSAGEPRHLVLDLALLPTRRRRAGRRLHQVVAHHLQEAAVELPLLADEHRVDGGLHVVVDAAPGRRP